MALGLATGGGGANATPYVSYDARAGRLFIVDRAQDATGTWVSNKVDITNTAQFVVDLANIQVGYIHYSEKGAIKIMAPLGKGLPPRPEDKDTNDNFIFRQAFNVMLAMSKDLGGGVRELNSTAACVIEGIDELHDKFTAAAESKAGKLPVVRIANVMPVKSSKSTNYKPIFEIVAWVDRPTALAVQNGDTATYATESVAKAATPPATGSTHVAPPPAQHVPVFQGQQNPVFQNQPDPVGSGDFG